VELLGAGRAEQQPVQNFDLGHVGQDLGEVEHHLGLGVGDHGEVDVQRAQVGRHFQLDLAATRLVGRRVGRVLVHESLSTGRAAGQPKRPGANPIGTERKE